MLTSTQRSVLTELRRALSNFLQKDLVALKLFGSRARGDAEAGSDLDIALVVSNLSRERRREILDLVAEIEFEWLEPVSLLLLSRQDFERMRSRERRIALDLEREGIAF